MKNFKTFYDAQTASRLKKIIQTFPNHLQQIKPYYNSGTKNFLWRYAKNIQTSAFKVLQECGFWASRNCAVQMFFPTPNRHMFARKFIKLERFLAVLQEHIAFNVE